MQNRGLVFIPDISGFSRFVSETEINHSRMIIQELLEILINANNIGLEVSEIEGDAILFYKFGDPPGLQTLYKQVEQMFCAFHQNLIAYELRKYCQCQACLAAVNLSLKVITHYGEFTGYTVKNFSKLIGKDIIVAHQLLKNDIDQHEYWLVTQSLLPENKPDDLANGMQWNSGIRKTESGEVAFQYTQLGQLKNKLRPEQIQSLELSDKTKLISVSHEYDTDIITLFHATGDFSHRGRWQEGVERVEELNHYLPRVGMRCRCVLKNGEEIIYTSSYYQYQPERIVFCETDEKRKITTCFTLEKTGPGKTKLIVDLYLNKNAIAELSFKLLRKKPTEQLFVKSLLNLINVVKTLRIPSA
ncbi:MAG: DUF2652 domain-containing protein [Flammeovirgaceae bacterium]|nr:DUF2652 domain-containing protein [Flammeovirgaceae bacterium]